VRGAIERRLTAAERRLNPPVPRIQEIVILGGLPGLDEDDPTVAAAGHGAFADRPRSDDPICQSHSILRKRKFLRSTVLRK